MWAIFVALFGGLYLAYKLGSDVAASKRFDREHNKHMTCWEEWERSVVDNSVEDRIESDIMSPETFIKLKQDTIELIRTFHGLKYADFNTYYDAKHKDFYVREMVKYIELVKRGKLPSLGHGDVPNYLELSLDIRPSKRSRIEFGKWLEKTMRSNGVSCAALYYTGKSYASFAWAPYIANLSSATRIDDPELESKMMGISTEETDRRNSVIIRRKLEI